MQKNKVFLIILATAAIFRFGLFNISYHGDLNNNISWARLSVERGLAGFYGSDDARDWPYSAPNQPPLTMLTFAGMRLLFLAVNNAANFLNEAIGLFPSGFIWFWERSGMIFTIKLPSILADIGIGMWIYFFLKGRVNKKNLALAISSVWLFNPLTWYNSSIWGQTDSIVNLLGLLAMTSLLDRKLSKFAIFFTTSLLFKSSLAIFAPIFLFITICHKYSLKEWLRSTVYVILFVFFISFWFHPQLDIVPWLFNLYRQRILPGEIGYLTANAFNFWWLVDPGKVLDSAYYLGLPARIWGFVGLTVVIGSTTWIFLRKKMSEKKIFIVLSLVALGSFLFMTRIHERYMYPFFPYATLLLAYSPGFWITYAVLSTTHLFNLYHLFWEPPIPFIEQLFTSPAFPQALSVLNVLAFFYIIYQFRSVKV